MSTSDSKMEGRRPLEAVSELRVRAESKIHTWQSEELLGDRDETWIVHHGVTYRLLRTRNDKLILVK